MLIKTRRLTSSWWLIAKRSLAHWKLLSSTVIGVLLASSIISGTVIYFDALRELSLHNTLAKYEDSQLNILIQGRMGPTSPEAYKTISMAVNNAIDSHIGWMISDRVRFGKTSTFFLANPGDELRAGQDNRRSYFAFIPRLNTKITLQNGSRFPVEGSLSVRDYSGAIQLEAIIPQKDADTLGIAVGDRLSAVPPSGTSAPYISVIVSGVFVKNDPLDNFWHLEKEILNALTGASFQTVSFHISEKTYLELLGPSLPAMDTSYGWLLDVDSKRLSARNSATALAGIETLEAGLNTDLRGFRQSTVLDNSLAEYDQRLFFSKLPMYVVLALIAVVVLYYVTTLSTLIVEDRRNEVSLLRSRGASSFQILAVFIFEGATIAVIAIVLGPLIAACFIQLLGFTPLFSDLTGGGSLPVNISSSAVMLSFLGGALSFVSLIIPAVQASRIGVTDQRKLAARPSPVAAFQKYYVDVFLVLIAMFFLYQLMEQGSVVAQSLFGDLVVSQATLVVPGLMMVGLAVLLLRLFPLAMTLLSRIAAPRLSIGIVLGVWLMARNPSHYSRLALLLILTAGLGVFSSSFGGTMERSFEERVLYATGSDIRVDGARPRNRQDTSFRRSQKPLSTYDMAQVYEGVADVDSVSLALRATGRDLSEIFGEGFDVLAVDTETFGKVAWFRDDFADQPMNALLESLKLGDPESGLVLPEDTRYIEIRLKTDRPHPTVRLSVGLRDSAGRHFTRVLGVLNSRGWTVIGTDLGYRNVAVPEAALPLALVSIRLDDASGRQKLDAGSILIDEVTITTQNGKAAIIESFNNVEAWSLMQTSLDSRSDVLRFSEIGLVDELGSAMFAWAGGRTLTAHGIYYGRPRSPLPVLVSESFLETTGHSIGQEIEVQIAGYMIPVKILAETKYFPTMTKPNQHYLVLDLNSLTWHTNLATITRRELIPNQVWMSTETSGVERRQLLEELLEIESFSSEVIYDREELLMESKVDPLVEAGWGALLFVAFTAVLVLSCVGFLTHAYLSLRNRRLQFALLRTVGFHTKQLMFMVWFEQVLIIGSGMVLGTWMGGRLGSIIMPFLSHDDFGVEVMPPYLMTVNWDSLLLTYTAMMMFFGVFSLVLVGFIQRMSLQRILRLGEL